jgi:hypothetical protein
MARPPPPFAPCKLCGVPSDLRDSHIMPRWTYRRAIRTGGGDPNLVMIHNDVARRGGKQLSEYMLCSSCEALFERWEGYLAKIALQEDETFPALEASVSVPEIPTSGGARAASVVTLDVRAIERFAVSVIWRASASRLDELSGVSLGERYHRELGKYLRDEGAELPTGARLFVELIDATKDLPIDRMMIAPHSSKSVGYHLHRFALFGMVFNFAIGGQVPRTFDPFSLADTKRVIVSDGMQLVATGVGALIGRAQANGGVRRGRRASRAR